MQDQKISQFYNKLFPDELDMFRYDKHNRHVMDTRLNIPQKEIIIVSTPKGRSDEKYVEFKKDKWDKK